jgi:heme-degrading monooxygenase HmoA
MLLMPGTPDFSVEVILGCCGAEDGTTMFVILWHLEVKPGNLARFEKAYGPKGQWVQLFRRDAHFRDTQLLHDPSNDLCYFTLDCWDSETAYRAFLANNKRAYDELDASLQGLTANERHVVSFELNNSKDPNF